jgi:hypothetical protein
MDCSFSEDRITMTAFSRTLILIMIFLLCIIQNFRELPFPIMYLSWKMFDSTIDNPVFYGLGWSICKYPFIVEGKWVLGIIMLIVGLLME